MTEYRADAARNRSRILAVARQRDVRTLRLNDVARDAGVGVGTVYRHFPNVQSLVEALTAETIEQLLDFSRRAAAESDAGTAFFSFLRSAIDLHLEDSGLQAVLLAPDDASEDVTSAKLEISALVDRLLRDAQSAGAVRDDIRADQLGHLVCGVEHAVRLGSDGDQSLFIDVIFEGLRPRAR